jgi:hypothetical protein
MRRATAFVIGLGVSLLVLGGCSSSTTPEPTPAPTPAPPTPTPEPTPTPTPEPTPLVCDDTEAEIEDLDLAQEIVTIWGWGPMEGYRLRSVEGDQWYGFPENFELNGVEVEIRSGPGDCARSDTVLCWTTEEIWDNAGDTAELYDCQGTLIDTLKRP